MKAPDTKTSEGLLDVSRFDRSPLLGEEEAHALDALSSVRFFRHVTQQQRTPEGQALARLYEPIRAVLEYVGLAHQITIAWGAFLDHMRALGRPYFAWSPADWVAFAVGPCARRKVSRSVALSVAYLACDLRDPVALQQVRANPTSLARRVFGSAALEAAHARLLDALTAVGYPRHDDLYLLRSLSLLLLAAGAPSLEAIRPDAVEAAYALPALPVYARMGVYRISCALDLLGILERPLRIPGRSRVTPREGVAAEWAAWCARWRTTSARAKKARQDVYGYLMRVGLWLNERHPEVHSPADWSLDTCLDLLAMVSEAVTEQYVFLRGRFREKPLTAKSKAEIVHAVRVFFLDLQAWQWIPPRFAPHVALALPEAIKRQLGPQPRDIEEKTWLKLIWASLNLQAEDLPHSGATGQLWYPFELVRAAAVLWTHAGLRMNELCRLRCGCTKAQAEELVDEETERRFPPGTICYLEVPFNKTSAPFAKPVAGVVHEAVAAWEAVRPAQPRRLDGKTGHWVDYLLSYKGRQIGMDYLNNSVIPMLCRKAGVPLADGRGRFTSHRGRSSAVTMLANARWEMSLVELMKWCGHKNPGSTLHYLRLRPAKLARAYARADDTAYLIEVLIDQEAVLSGSAAAGEAWKYYDLGSSYCTHAFWSTCPHRLACAGCAFNVPKASARGQAIAAKAFLGRYLERVPLTEDERQAVQGDLGKLDAMLAKLERVAAPDGQIYDRLDDSGGGERSEGDGAGPRAITPLIPLPISHGTNPT